MSIVNAVGKRTTFQLLQLLQTDYLIIIILVVTVLVCIVTLLCIGRGLKARRRTKGLADRKRKNARTDTVPLPESREVLSVAYGFIVEQDITYIHTNEMIE